MPYIKSWCELHRPKACDKVAKQSSNSLRPCTRGAVDIYIQQWESPSYGRKILQSKNHPNCHRRLVLCGLSRFQWKSNLDTSRFGYRHKFQNVELKTINQSQLRHQKPHMHNRPPENGLKALNTDLKFGRRMIWSPKKNTPDRFGLAGKAVPWKVYIHHDQLETLSW